MLIDFKVRKSGFQVFGVCVIQENEYTGLPTFRDFCVLTYFENLKKGPNLKKNRKVLCSALNGLFLKILKNAFFAVLRWQHRTFSRQIKHGMFMKHCFFPTQNTNSRIRLIVWCKKSEKTLHHRHFRILLYSTICNST